MTAGATTRRALLRAGAGATVTAAPLVVAAVAAAQDDDASVLARVARREQALALTYDALAAAAGVGQGVTRLAADLAAEERRHLDALAAALRELGSGLPAPPAVQLPPALDRRAAVRLAIERERQVLAAWYDALGRLQDAKLLQQAIATMADEGTHLVAWRRMAGDPLVPVAAESGS